MLKIFVIKPDYDLSIMKQGQDLYDAAALYQLGRVETNHQTRYPFN